MTPPRRGRVRVGLRAPGDGGASAVEFALIVTLLFLILFGLINFGIIFSQQLTLNNAVREGARKAVVTNDGSTNRTCQGILNSTRNELSGLAMSPADVTFKITTSGWSTTKPCTPQSPDAAGFSKSVTPATQANIPCTGSGTSTGIGSLVVEARYRTSALIGFPPFSNAFTVQSKAVYRCEFSS